MSTIAFLGTGHIHTPGFIKRVNETTGVDVKYVYDKDEARASKNATELSAKVADLDTILQDKEVTAVIICSETNQHEALIEACVKAGKHLFAEKPLGFAGEDSLRIASAVKSAGLIFQTGYFMRSHPINIYLKKLVAESAFGTITRLRMANCHSGSLRGIFDTDWAWMAKPEISGCGAFGDLGTHALDIMLWLLGDVEKATATVKGYTNRYPGCDEAGEGLLRFKNGVIGSLSASWLDLANPITFELNGTEGKAYVLNGELYLQSENIEGADAKSPWTDLPPAHEHPLANFLSHIDGDTSSPLIDVDEAARVCTVMEAMYKGAEQDCWIEPLK